MPENIVEQLKLVVAAPGRLQIIRELGANRIYGFQFQCSGFSLAGVVCPTFDFLQHHNGMVFGLSTGGQYISEDMEIICELIYTDHMRVGKTRDLVLSGYGGQELEFTGRLFTPLPIGEQNPFIHLPNNDGNQPSSLRAGIESKH